MTLILDGKALAISREKLLRLRVSAWRQSHKGKPHLATILVGDDPSSFTYVRMKGNACNRIGLEQLLVHMPATTSTHELLQQINALNDNPNVFGILLQHPVPPQIDERACFEEIAIQKDTDGVTTQGFGRMAMGLHAYGSATPTGIMTLLREHQVKVRGRRAVVIGRSPILGKPMAAMLLNADATVTVCHSRTDDLASVVADANLVVAAVGKPLFIPGLWIPDDAVVVDAGYHAGWVGDIDALAHYRRWSAYTPVPGGVGPMTISALLENTVVSMESQNV